jgi:hypothetical protein
MLAVATTAATIAARAWHVLNWKRRFIGTPLKTVQWNLVGKSPAHATGLFRRHALAGELPAKDVTANITTSIAAQSAEQRPAIHGGKTAGQERPHLVPTLLPSASSTNPAPGSTPVSPCHLERSVHAWVVSQRQLRNLVRQLRGVAAGTRQTMSAAIYGIVSVPP